MGIISVLTTYLTIITALMFNGWKEVIVPIFAFLTGAHIYIFLGKLKKKRLFHNKKWN